MWRRILTPDELTALAESENTDIVDGISIEGSGLQRLDTIMVLACERGYLDIVKNLVYRGADKNLNVDYLCIAAEHDWIEIAQYLIERGVAIDGKSSRQGYTPLMTAAANGSLATFELLVRAGANIDISTAEGFTAIQIVKHTIQSREKMNQTFPRKLHQNCKQILHHLEKLERSPQDAG